jgi:hypothetical protein
VRSIVCAFSGELPTAWLAVFHRFERRIAKEGFRVRVRLSSLEELPERVDVLVVPPELRDRATAAARASHLVVTTRQDAPAAADELVAQLRRGNVLRAERVVADEPRIVTHRGIREL